MEYSKNTFLNNIDYLIKKNNLKISTVESYCMVSSGYFARFRQSEQDSPNLKIVVFLSKILNVPIDLLLFSDCTQISDEELIVLDFIDKLDDKTRNGEIKWKKSNDLSTFKVDFGSVVSEITSAHRYIDIEGQSFFTSINEKNYLIVDVYDEGTSHKISENVDFYLITDSVYLISKTDFYCSCELFEKLIRLRNDAEVNACKAKLSKAVIDAIKNFK